MLVNCGAKISEDQSRTRYFQRGGNASTRKNVSQPRGEESARVCVIRTFRQICLCRRLIYLILSMKKKNTQLQPRMRFIDTSNSDKNSSIRPRNSSGHGETLQNKFHPAHVERGIFVQSTILLHIDQLE